MDAIKDLETRVTLGYAVNNGVKIHYAFLGKGSLIVMLHGFPDYWYSWRHQMAALASNTRLWHAYLRGYNLSDKPKGSENYDMKLLVGDVRAVIRHQSYDKAIIVGHDWGGAIAWQFAMHLPAMTARSVSFS